MERAQGGGRTLQQGEQYQHKHPATAPASHSPEVTVVDKSRVRLPNSEKRIDDGFDIWWNGLMRQKRAAERSGYSERK